MSNQLPAGARSGNEEAIILLCETSGIVFVHHTFSPKLYTGTGFETMS